MRRKIYDTFLKWKNTEKGRVALMIEGARRIGKSYIVEEFAKKEYRSYIMIDFAHLSKALRNVFDNYLEDTETFLTYLQNVTGTRLYERESLIIFDEVQRYGRAREAIKYLVADGRYDYIETGSLVSIMENKDNITIPSEERSIPMYPMDFEEFLWAIGDEMTMPFIRECFNRHQGLGPVHRKASDLMRLYMIVGGMPQAVGKYLETKNLQDVDIVKRDILALYRKDISKHAKGYEAKVRSVFDHIPAELQKHEKRFRLSDMEKGARFRSYESSFLWLDDAKIVLRCNNVTAPQIGMALTEDDEIFKCYSHDTGLLMAHAFNAKTIEGEELYQKLLLDKLEINGGMLVENLVAQMFVASGHKLFFYHCSSQENAQDRMEIDFLIEKQTLTNRHNIYPIEVKSGKRMQLTSIGKFCAKFHEQLATPFVIHDGEYMEKNGYTYIPLYMTPCL